MKTPELFLILLVGGCGVGPVTSPNPNEDASAAPGNDGFAGEGNDGSVESGGPGNLAVATAPDNGVARDLAIPEGADLSVGEGSRDLAMAKAPDLSVLPPGADLAMSIAPPDLAMAHPGADLAMSVHPSDLAMSVATDLATSVHPPDLAMSVATDLATSAPPTDLATSAPPTGSEFLGGAEGLGTPVIDASPDESGNVWAVAPDALYIRRAGQTSFRRYTNADGLHIWTTITSVAGAGTNEGYLGLQGYESDDPVSDPPDLQVQGKAEHVHLHADGTIDALHYSNLATDVDPTYTKTRTAYRLLFSHDGVSAGHLFMGGNHGITHIFNDGWGDHVHVEIYYMPEHSGTYGLWYGLAIDPKTGGLWTCGKNGCGREEYIATPRQWSQGHYDTAFTVFTSDHGLEVPHGYEEQYVGAATTPDGTAWFASRLFGLAKWEGGTISPVVVPGLGTPVDIAGDPDGSLWVTDGSQVLRYVPSTGATTSLPLGSSDVRRLYVWSHGPRALYISTGGGLQIYRGP